jgi:hypothetical protein
MSKDRTLICKTCGNEFTFTAREQEFFAQKGFSNDPKNCSNCREKAKKDKVGRENYITCKSCGKTEKVSFQLVGSPYLLCDDCFTKLKPQMPSIPHAQQEEPAKQT